LSAEDSARNVFLRRPEEAEGRLEGRRIGVLALLLAALLAAACGPVPRPKDAYTAAPDLLADMLALRARVKALRAAGRIDHFGEERVQGRMFAFAEPPARLRVDLVSPLGSTLAVLTVAAGAFSMSDEREGKYYAGPAAPCNIARLIRIPLPVEDAIRVLVGSTPVIEGSSEVTWDKAGHYDVRIAGAGGAAQLIEIGPDRDVLPLLRSRISEGGATVLEITCDRWARVGDAHVPFEIRAAMPREKEELLVRYDEGAVEADAEIPAEAWTHVFPDGAAVEQVTCE
jgi:outer membrane biogenesis lipoprotein LolB